MNVVLFFYYYTLKAFFTIVFVSLLKGTGEGIDNLSIYFRSHNLFSQEKGNSSKNEKQNHFTC